MADLMTARNADRENPRFSFLGVYASVDSSEATRDLFIESGADAVAPTVNQLP